MATILAIVIRLLFSQELKAYTLQITKNTLFKSKHHFAFFVAVVGKKYVIFK